MLPPERQEEEEEEAEADVLAQGDDGGHDHSRNCAALPADVCLSIHPSIRHWHRPFIFIVARGSPEAAEENLHTPV